jgi:predicted RNA-binding Zn-ribbon protein involved in translation (DUF1610 family)
MGAQQPDKDEKKPNASAHVCPRCGFSIDLKNIGLRGAATGLITCRKCDWSGPVEMQIVDKEPLDSLGKSRTRANGGRPTRV